MPTKKKGDKKEAHLINIFLISGTDDITQPDKNINIGISNVDTSFTIKVYSSDME